MTGGPAIPDFTEPALSANLALAEGLRPVAERHGVTPAAVAVAWTLAFPGVTGAIVGARSPRQVDGWLPAASLELKDDDLSDIAAAIHATERRDRARIAFARVRLLYGRWLLGSPKRLRRGGGGRDGFASGTLSPGRPGRRLRGVGRGGRGAAVRPRPQVGYAVE